MSIYNFSPRALISANFPMSRKAHSITYSCTSSETDSLLSKDTELATKPGSYVGISAPSLFCFRVKHVHPLYFAASHLFNSESERSGRFAITLNDLCQIGRGCFYGPGKGLQRHAVPAAKFLYWMHGASISKWLRICQGEN